MNDDVEYFVAPEQPDNDGRLVIMARKDGFDAKVVAIIPEASDANREMAARMCLVMSTGTLEDIMDKIKDIQTLMSKI